MNSVKGILLNGKELLFVGEGNGDGSGGLELFGNDMHNGKTVFMGVFNTVPICGQVRQEEETKVITLSDDLDEGKYQLKFELSDGNTVDIKEIEEV